MIMITVIGYGVVLQLVLTVALTHTAAYVGFAGWALAAVGVECIVMGICCWFSKNL